MTLVSHNYELSVTAYELMTFHLTISTYVYYDLLKYLVLWRASIICCKMYDIPRFENCMKHNIY